MSSSVGMRFFSVYGPKETAKKQYANMVTQFLWEMRDGKAPVIFGDGLQTRDFTYVKDVTRALQLAMKSDYHGILNVGTGKAYTFNQTVEILNKNMGLALKAATRGKSHKELCSAHPFRHCEGRESARV